VEKQTCAGVEKHVQKRKNTKYIHGIKIWYQTYKKEYNYHLKVKYKD
jgi:hypothetical protein